LFVVVSEPEIIIIWIGYTKSDRFEVGMEEEEE
jgi:hypothetical protein